MILQIDMGNTRLKWRLRKGCNSVAHGSVTNQEGFTPLASMFEGHIIEQILVASVVGEESNTAFAAWAAKHLGITPLFAKAQSRCAGVVNGYHFPERLGVDRWLAMLGAFGLVQCACVVVDCGSAITVDLLDNQGVHQGGYIAPGVEAMRRALFSGTQGVKIEGIVGESVAPGRDTVAAVSSAQMVMVIGLVQHALRQLSSAEASPHLLLTGGDAPWLATVLDNAIVVPDLIFDGLELAFAAR